MLNQAAFANSLAILTGALYLLYYLISLVAPQFFRHLFNAQFLGADVALAFSQRNFLQLFRSDASDFGDHGLDFWLRVGVAI